MAKYIVNTVEDIQALKTDATIVLKRGDIIVHKPFEFYMAQGHFQKYFDSIELFPVSPGTEVYTINGYNTSVIKSI